ncbi:MAG TPA: hypothetical protein VGJ66_10705 [Pyrinomonadaceae bacterium]|jgi:hypothetical protein
MIKRFAASALGFALITLVTFPSFESQASAHGSGVLVAGENLWIDARQ